MLQSPCEFESDAIFSIMQPSNPINSEFPTPQPHTLIEIKKLRR
ncbi:hypothetical protein [Rubritalea tangerina]